MPVRDPVAVESAEDTRIPLAAGTRGAEQELLPFFFAGPENQLIAHIAGSDETILQRGNPWLLVGPTGVGKTALARCLLQRQTAVESGQVRVLMEPATEFARRYAEAIEADDIEHFRTRYDRPEILVLDEIQTLVGKPAAQNELVMRIDMRLKKGRGLIATANALPLQIRGLRAPLASRLLGGLTIPIAPPGPAARLAILASLSEKSGESFSAEELTEIDRKIPPRVPARRLHAALQQLSLQRKLAGQDVPLTAHVIDEAVRSAGSPTLATIASAVAKRYKLRSSDLRSDTRRQSVVLARSLAMYLARQLADVSLQQVGKYFGGRDHSTVLHALRKIEGEIRDNADVARSALELADQLRGG